MLSLAKKCPHRKPSVVAWVFDSTWVFLLLAFQFLQFRAFFSNPGRMPFVKSAKSNCTTEHADKKEPTRQHRANTQFEEKSSQGNFCKQNHKATIRTDLRELANCSSKQHLAINAFVPRQKKRGFSTSRIFKDCICTRRESQSGAWIDPTPLTKQMHKLQLKTKQTPNERRQKQDPDDAQNEPVDLQNLQDADH